MCVDNVIKFPNMSIQYTEYSFCESQENCLSNIPYTEYTNAGAPIPMLDKRVYFTSPSLKLGKVNYAAPGITHY